MTEFPSEPPAPTPALPAPPSAAASPPPPPRVDHHAPPPPPPPRERSGDLALAVAVIGFLVLGGGLYWVWSHPQAAAPNGDAGVQIQALSGKVDGAVAQMQGLPGQIAAVSQAVQRLSDRVSQLEKTLPPAASTQTDTSEIAKRLDQVAARQDTLAGQQEAAAASVQNRIEAAITAERGNLEQALAKQNQAIADADAKDAQALSDAGGKTEAAVTALGQKVEQGLAADKAAVDSLSARVEKLENGAGQVEGMADRAARLGRLQAAEVALQSGEKLGAIPGAPPALARFADTAPPTEASLRAAFPAVAERALAASRPDVKQKPLLERMLARVEQNLTVRRGDEVVVGDPAAGVITRAEELVRNGDLAGAVSTLNRLSGPAAEAVAEWKGRAQSLLDARSALAALVARG